MFRLDRRRLWPRTWVAAAVLTAYAVASAALLGRPRALPGPVSAAEVLVGLAVGGAWLVVTHAGAAVLRRAVPAFMDQVADLYRLGADDAVTSMVGPLLAMAVAEELLFRGLIQGRAGFAAGVAAYSAVQLVEGNWVLVLAAFFCGVVWGALFTWRGGLVAPIVAHAVWTSALTFVWPLPASPSADPVPAG
jgi:hypothetical protein